MFQLSVITNGFQNHFILVLLLFEKYFVTILGVFYMLFYCKSVWTRKYAFSKHPLKSEL